MIYMTTLPYTVPTPQGKSPGVSGDGRLHLLAAHQVATVGDGMPGAILTYTFSGHVARWRTGNNGSACPVEGGTTYHQLHSEPSIPTFGGEVTGEPLQVIVNGAGSAFTWLLAGTVVDFVRDTDLGAGAVVVDLVLVEDYGQLGEGDQYSDRVRTSQFGGLLLTEG